MNFLNTLIEQKLLEISIQSVKQPIEEIKQIKRELPIIDFNESFKSQKNKIITDIKQKLISKDLDKDRKLVLDIIHEYEKNGVNALSILTDKKFFDGSLNFLKFIKKNTKIPILQKDFIISEYQIFQAFINGADGIILIAEALDYYQLKDFYQIAKDLNIEIFFEIHEVDSIDKVNKLNPNFMVVSSRNLNNMIVNIQDFIKFKSLISEGKIVFVEGGIKSDDDYKFIKKLNYNGVFLGANLMLQDSPGKIIKDYFKQ